MKAIENVSFNIPKGQTLGVVGESGSGKSTLARAILGLEKEAQGRILYDGQNLLSLSNKAFKPLRRDLQIVFQDPYGSLSPRMSCEQIIGEGLEVNNLAGKQEREHAIIHMMKTVGLNPDDRFRYPNEFSGGQRQRIAIARAMILNPKLIILDEPTSSLDRTVQFQVIELLRTLQDQQKLTYLFISHDLKVVRSMAHDVIVMKQGKIIEQGADVFKNPQHEYTRELVECAFL